jgi:catechol 2,3-dioxygenase-like lactoylglutathione lyase family enzyme
MLDHIGIDVSDIARSRQFYTAALAPLGYAMTKDLGTATGFGVASGPRASADPGGEFWLAQGTPHAPLPHIAFNAGSRAEVDAFHAAALAAGGQDNGAPGIRERYEPNYYAAFILDPDGYNIEAVCHRPE